MSRSSAWSPHVDMDDAAAVVTLAVGDKIVQDTGKRVSYRLQKKLGQGAYGAVWAANLAEDPEEGPSRFAIKSFTFDGRRMRISEYEDSVRREFFVSQLLANADDGTFCERYGICANNYFRVGPRVFPQMYIVFPFERVQSLSSFLEFFWATYKKDDPLPYQRTGMTIASQMLRALGELHAFQIYHQDVKPDNLVVSLSDSGEFQSIKFIDYGLSCVNFGPNSVLGSLGRTLGVEQNTACTLGSVGDGAIYNTTSWYRDPRSGGAPEAFHDWFVENSVKYRPRGNKIGESVVFKQRHVPFLWPKFDVFAAAVVTQLIFDPDQLQIRAQIHRTGGSDAAYFSALTVYHSERMPGSLEDGLGRLLFNMTGTLTARQSASEYSLQLKALMQIILSKKRKAEPTEIFTIPAPAPPTQETDDDDNGRFIVVNPRGGKIARGESPL